MSQAHHDPFAHSAGVTQSAVLPFILIILLVLSEIAFTLIALTGQESLRWMSEATQARSDHWSDAINRTASVSYTHLDVYKRQPRDNALPTTISSQSLEICSGR